MPAMTDFCQKPFLVRGNALLVDVEQAKKDEWVRRRKLRLQQVRQQSKELANVLREKVKVEKQCINKGVVQKRCETFDQWKRKHLQSLQNELDTNLQSVGSGHNNALREIEINLLDEERKKVMSELAKARGSLALQKQKQEEFEKEKSKHSVLKRKEFARSVENLRSALVATLPQPPKQPQKPTVKHSPKKPKVTYPPAGQETRGGGRRSFKGTSVAGKVIPLSPCESSNGMERASSNLPPYPQEGLSPPRQRPPNRGRVQFKEFRKSPDMKKSPCPPPPPPPLRRERTRHLSDCDSDVSCESDVTWPPACGHRPILVYDHDGKECRRYAPPEHPLVIPTSPNDSFTMGYEEELRQMEAGALRRQEEEVRRRRGCRAAYKQRLRSEFSCMMKDLAALDRQQRLAAVQSNAFKALGPRNKRKGNTCEDAPGRSYRFGDIPRQREYPGSERQREAVNTVEEFEKEDSFVEKEKAEQGTEENEDDDSSLERACQPHLQALDSLLVRLQRQRDHLLAADVYRRADECQKRLMCSDTEDESHNIPSTKQKSPCVNSSPPKVRADTVPSLRKSLPRPADQESSTSNRTPSSPAKRKYPNNSKSTSSSLSGGIPEKRTAKDMCDMGVQMSPKSVIHVERPLADAACNTSLHSPVRPCTSRGVSPVNDPIQDSPFSSTRIDESNHQCNHFVESLNSKNVSPPGSPSKTSPATCIPSSSDNHPDSLAASNTVSPKKSSNSHNPTRSYSPAKPSDSSSSDYSTLNSSSSMDAVKVVVKVTGKNSKLSTVKSKTVTITSGKSKGSSKPDVECTKESSTASVDKNTWARQLSSSDDTSRTSYRSPPPELNPSQKKLFYSILKKIDSKRKNPVLHEYICKLLGMRKESVDNLSVSTISEASVDSDVIYSHLDKCSKEDPERYTTVSKVPQKSLPCRKEMSGEGVKQEPTVVKKTLKKVIIESDSIEDESYHREKVREVIAPDNAQICTDMVDKFHDKLQNLAQMLDQLRVPSLKSLSENDTSYLNLPSKIEESVRISDSIRKQAGVPLAESTGDLELCEEVSGRRVESWGLSLSLEPRPQRARTSPEQVQPTPNQACLSQHIPSYQPQTVREDLPTRPRAKPPSSLYNTRRTVAGPVVPHELSTIAEMESTNLMSPPAQRTAIVTGPAVPGRDIEVKETQRSPECSFMSSASVSPVKMSEEHQPANESSSLMILSHLDDSLTGGHCTSTEELEQVFRSLGISWAVPTLRKMNAAARHAEESSSSGEARPRRYTHSTPNKQTQPCPPDLSLVRSSDSLDAPSVSLNTRYLNLIRSSPDSSSDPSPKPNSGSNS